MGGNFQSWVGNQLPMLSCNASQIWQQLHLCSEKRHILDWLSRGGHQRVPEPSIAIHVRSGHEQQNCINARQKPRLAEGRMSLSWVNDKQ